MFFIDHIDIVVTHQCNKRCQHCIDKFLRTYSEVISLHDVANFLKIVSRHVEPNKRTEVLLLGGEPTVIPSYQLKDLSNVIRNSGFSPIMSTNGLLRDKIMKLMPYYDWFQVTVDSHSDIDFYRPFPHKINIKLSGDESLTIEKFEDFISTTKDFERRSISMYFTEDWTELCKDEAVLNLLDTLEWTRNGSYLYTFYKNVRIKRSIYGETNLIDEPTVPKLYPNGNYNKTWNNEDMDDYLR